MKNAADDGWELAGYGLWLVGILFFGVAALRNGDGWSLVGSSFFLIGIVVVMVPMARTAMRR